MLRGRGGAKCGVEECEAKVDESKFGLYNKLSREAVCLLSVGVCCPHPEWEDKKMMVFMSEYF